jgi:putative acetyltransferase
MTNEVVIERVDSVTDDVRALIFELDTELAAAYPPEQLHGLTLRSLFEPHVQFFIARLNDAAVGCGGIAFFEGFAEVKRMYVRKVARGEGVAQALLEHLEGVARNAGVALLRLETGVRQPAAMRLYERFGFRSCAAFPPYTSMARSAVKNSMFYEKRLSES